MAVSADDVKRVANVTTDVTIMLAAANTITTDHLADKDLSSESLDLITLYVAAHLVVLSDENGGLRRSKLLEADESYRVPGDKDIGLESTRFGQMALMMDSSGTLAGLTANKGLKAHFEVV